MKKSKLSLFKFNEYSIKKYDFKIIILVAALATIGYLVLQSALANDPDVESILQKQLIGLGIGTAFMLVLSVFDYHILLKISPFIYLGTIALLILVLFIGVSVSDATRWVKIAGIQFQPSEFAKITVIVVFASFFENFKDKINKPTVVFSSVLLYAVLAFLIFKEPDLSTTIVTIIIFASLIYVAKISYKWIVGVILAAGAGFAAVVYMALNGINGIFKTYQLNRVLSWLFPEQYADTGLTTQQENSILAISSGQIYGKGLNNTSFESVKNGNFLSEEDCDFIFAVIGEELGFIGSLLILIAITLLVIECLRIAYKAKDLGGRLICVGFAALLSFQTFVNVGVATGLLPNTGLPLPFMSAGVSSLLSIFMGVGIVLNVALQKRDSDANL